MEFDGKIVRVLPAREGTSQRTGNTWKTLPFVFEFFEPDNLQWPKKVLLETFDTNYQAMIAPYIRRGQDGKAATNQYGDLDLMAPIPIHIGFSLGVRTGNRQDGTPFTMNELRIYKFEAIQQHSSANSAGTVVQPQPSSQQPQVAYAQNAPAQTTDSGDNLPF